MLVQNMVLMVYTTKDLFLKRSELSKRLELSKLVDLLYRNIGLDKKKVKFNIFGRYPVVVSPHLFTYVHLPVVNQSSLEIMLEVPSNHPSIDIVELYLDKLASDDGINSTACSSPLDNPGSSSKRQRTQQPREVDVIVDTDVTHPVVKLERDNGLEANAEFGIGSTHGRVMDKNSCSDGVAQPVYLTTDNDSAHKDLNVPGLEASANACLNKVASKPWLSSLWVDDHELRVGLCFKDKDELKKAVDWCTIRGGKKCLVKETRKDEYMIECIRWKCKWSVCAARMEEHGLVEITMYTGPHTCCSIRPKNFYVELAAEEIECLIRVQPTLTIAELNNWWDEKHSYVIEASEMKAAKQEVIKKKYGDWDQSFRVLPKLMAALQSSNGLVVDWQYDVFPNPEFASFRGVFWAFSQSIEGFKHCRPLIKVDTKDLSGKYPMKLMIASGLEADNLYFPLAFAVTKEVSLDSWRWFLSGIREKVTQRKDLCLISSPDPDILAVINEPGSLWKEPWAYHRFSLPHLCSQFHDIFQDKNLEKLVNKAGFAKKHDEFDSHMETIKKKNPEARRWLDQMPPHRWAIAHDGGRRYGDRNEDLFSVCESFQSLDLPPTAIVLLLFDEMRSFFLTGLDDSEVSLKFGDVYTGSVIEKLEEFMSASIAHVIMPLDKGVFQVTEPLQKDGCIVRLSECTCTCGEFQLMKFPCPHALVVCEKLKINPLQYVDDCHTYERCHKTYAATFSPVPEVSAWLEASGVPILLPPVILPPPPTKVSGKSKQKAIQEKS